MLKALRFISLLIGALNLGPALAHALEMAPKRAMSGPDWLTTQQAYRYYGKVSGMTFRIAFLSTLGTLVLVRHRPLTATLTAIGAVCTASTVAVWARFNKAVNEEFVTWQTDALSANSMERRDQWEFAHLASAGLHTIGLGVLIAPALYDDERSAAQ